MAQSRSVPDPGVAIGTVFLGKYRVESILGQGGMGVVAKCVHLGLDKFVAIKMLRQDVLLDPDAKERFLREAQAASRLRSEHVAEVSDVGHFPETGVPYMVMEFLDGHDLGDLVDERGAIAAPFASMLMLQAAEALAEAHSIGIVHRDVKPSNLFVTWRPDGSAIVKVLDFGISKAPNGTDMKLTQTQSLLGTPAYMSPEQMRSARLVDARTDIWSFGTVFYELLEGHRPFEAESFSEMCVKVAVDPPAPFVNTPPHLQPIITRCLAKNPDQRYANMAELGRDLMPHVQDVHQASLLVERMQRVLGRRSADQWESPTTGIISRAPVVVHDGGSAPVVAPWQGDHISQGVAMPTPSPFARSEHTPDPRTPVATLRDSSPPRAASDLGAPRKRSKAPFVFLGAFVAIGITIGLAYGLSQGDEPSDVTRVVAPDKTTIEAKPVDPKPVDPKSVDPKPVDPKPVDPKPVGNDGNPEIEMPAHVASGSGSAKPVIVVKQPNNTTAKLPTKVPPRGQVSTKPPDKKVQPSGKDTLMQPGTGSGPEIKKPKCAIHERLPSTNKCPGE